MKPFSIYRKQLLNLGIDEVWEFFSSPENLSKITPTYMDFQVVSSLPDEMYAGMIIHYKVSPVAGLRMNWVSEITQFEKHRFFIDEQKIGPYALWHHQHHFASLPNGTEVVDIVNYALPLGILGRIAHRVFVQRQLNAIFDYRTEVLKELLPEKQL